MKLTAAIRKQILTELMAHAFDSTEVQLAERENELAAKLYDATYSKREQEFMEEVGDSGFYMSSYVDTADPVTKQWVQLTLKAPRYVMAARYYVRVVQESELRREISKFFADREALRQLRRAASTEAEGILNSVTTVKRLLEVWPEVEAFVPKSTQQLSNLTALQLDKLNGLLGLPPGEKE